MSVPRRARPAGVACLAVLTLGSTACRSSTAPAATYLAFITEPTDAMAGAPIGPAIRVEVRDPTGHRVPDADPAVTLRLSANPGGAVLGGTTTRSAVNGVATFSDLSLAKAAAGYTLSATAAPSGAATSVSFSVSPAAAAGLRFLSQPDTAQAQMAFNPAVQVAIADAFGNLVADASPDVTVALLVNPPGAVLLGVTTAAAVHGVAQFDPLSVALPGDGFVLQASSPGLSSAPSAPFSVRLGFALVSGGGLHTCAVTVAGFAYCWGGNGGGQLGDGTTIERHLPTPVAGTLKFSLVSAGNGHTCGVTTEHVAYCWGSNDVNQLGDGTTSARSAPTPVVGGLAFAQVSAGYDHTCGITTDSVAYCWGRNDLGALGDSSTVQRATPTRVAGGLSFTQVAANTHTCGIARGNVAYCWGGNAAGELGDPTVTFYSVSPTRVAGTLSFGLVSAGAHHTCGLTTAAQAYCWGQGFGGTPTLIAGAPGFVQLSAGGDHTCAVTSGNAAYCWGDNIYGALGDGTTTARATPTPVVGSLNFVLVSAGAQHSCGITTSKVAYCWGYNFYGGLG
ncbi:MAG TPA: hypothetical protein VH137_08095, partial [Gemmatimonadales bacterium]|nr:hypothetical protein [Gemmatimonadales bacterium]